SGGSTGAAIATWRFMPASRLILTTTGAYNRNRQDVRSDTDSILASSNTTDVTTQTRALWSWSAGSTLSLGYTMRRTRDHGVSALALFESPALRSFDSYQGTAVTQSAFIQQVWNVWRGKAQLATSLRWQQQNRVAASPLLPSVSGSLHITSKSTFEV